MLGLLYSLVCGGFFYDLIQEKRDLPLRVNRQRREVALPVKVSSKKQAYVYVPWEELVVWVRSKTRVAATGVTGSVELTLAKENQTTPGTYDATVTYYPGSMVLALGLWESIRCYMEQGPEHCPPGFEEKLKGKVSFSSPTLAGYKALLKENKDQYDFKWMTSREYYQGFLFKMWLQGGSLPYRISDWYRRRAPKALPRASKVWAKPLPKAQWAQPSAELQAANAFLYQVYKPGGVGFTEAMEKWQAHCANTDTVNV